MLLSLKPILSSRTVLSNLVGLLALLLTTAGVPQAAIGEPSAIVDAVLQLVAAASFLASTAFRILAVRRLA